MYNTLGMQTTIYKDQILDICNQENIEYLGLFGSWARGDERKKSDIDILIQFADTKSFFQLAKIQEEFENIFQKKVDLVLKDNIKESLKPYILKDLITLYEKK